MFRIKDLKPIEKEWLDNCYRDKEGNFNPFHYDLYNMGRRFDKDTFFMFRSHDTEDYTSGYFVNVKTGERQQLIKD